MDYKQVLGSIATAIAILAFVPYFWDIYKAETKPHAFSWLIWGILQTIGFAAQIVGHAGPGAWSTGLTGFICFIIAGIGFYQSEIKFVLFDWLALVGAALAIIFWLITKNPFYSVLLISAADFIAFLPTYRKAWRLPFTETLSEFVASFFKEAIALLALRTFSFITAFYISSLAISNLVFVFMVLIRRKQKTAS
jgi:hypothetical protein